MTTVRRGPRGSLRFDNHFPSSIIPSTTVPLPSDPIVGIDRTVPKQGLLTGTLQRFLRFRYQVTGRAA